MTTNNDIFFLHLFAMNYILVFLGGGLGSLLRYAVTVFVGANFPRAAMPFHEDGFPWTTLCINVLGSCAIGVVVQLAAINTVSTANTAPTLASVAQTAAFLSPEGRLFLAVGVCGGFTTFSTFSLETLALLQTGRILAAGLYALASVCVCVVGTASGLGCVAWWMKWRGF
jgi:fluoride exporter